MTLVVGVNSTFDAFAVADCRLLWRSAGGPVVRDACQKIVMATHWAAAGFSGDLCLGRHLMAGFVKRIRQTPFDDPGWLKDNDELMRFVVQGIAAHVLPGPAHAECQKKEASVLIAWMDYSRSIYRAREGDEERFIPGAEITVVRTPRLGQNVRRTRRGIDTIGSGSKIKKAMREQAYNMLMGFGRFDGDADVMAAHRALLGTQVVRDLLADQGGDEGVGGLYEVIAVDKHKVWSVPYFYLAPVEPGYRTYVAMRPVDGQYVQEHRPTGIRVPIASPFDIDPFAPPGQSEIFDPTRMLTRHSPGVIPERPWQLAWQLYDPAEFPDAIRESWGDAPLDPSSWALVPDAA
jgi:hypothetical protein